MYPDIVFTIDARENVFLETMKATLDLSTTDTYREIRVLFEQLIDILRNKKIDYNHLKPALVPRANRKEVALVFDTTQIKSAAYGSEVFSNILPLLEHESVFSCLCGDYIANNEHQLLLRDVFFLEIQQAHDTTYRHSSQYFIVYLNNLSDRHFTTLTKGLLNYKAFIGHFDLTFDSPMKTLLSTMLIRLFIKNKMTVLLSSEDSEDGNSTMYPFEEHGYKCLGIAALCYGLFLSYKIERNVFPGFELDTTFSINTISQNALDILDFNLVIEERKHKYLLQNKIGNLKRANLHTLTQEELEAIIKRKLNDNYLYNLSYTPEFNTIKFNILLEVPRIDKKESMKLVAALEYMESTKVLRLITLF